MNFRRGQLEDFLSIVVLRAGYLCLAMRSFVAFTITASLVIVFITGPVIVYSHGDVLAISQTAVELGRRVSTGQE